MVCSLHPCDDGGEKGEENDLDSLHQASFRSSTSRNQLIFRTSKTCSFISDRARKIATSLFRDSIMINGGAVDIPEGLRIKRRILEVCEP